MKYLIRIASVVAGATALLALTAAPVLADAGDTLIPASTSFTVTNNGNVTITGTIDGINITITCKNVSLTARTPPASSPSLTANVTSSPPVTFSNCSDSLGGTDKITTSGSWSITITDGGDPAPEPNSGDQVTVSIPNNGATITSSAIQGCVITVNASTPTSSTFDGSTNWTFINASLNVKGAGCMVSTPAKFSGAFVSSISLSDTS